MTEPLNEARTALAERRWSFAVDAFLSADGANNLETGDLQRLAALAQQMEGLARCDVITLPRLSTGIDDACR